MVFEQPPVDNPGKIIEQAEKQLDAYNSPRSRAANTELEVSGAASKVIKTPDRSLTFFGSFHTIDPESKTVEDLRTDLRETLSVIHPEDLVLMIEGEYAQCDRAVVIQKMEGVEIIEDAVAKHGEGGVAMWIVADYAKRGVEIEISSPERSELEIAAEVRKDFASEDIATYLTLRQWTTELGGRRTGEYSVIDLAKQCMSFAEISGVDWIPNRKTDDEIREFLHDQSALVAYASRIAQQFIDELNTKTGLTVSLEDLRHRRADESVMQEIDELSDPMDYGNRQTSVNKVAARWNEERDRFLVRTIGGAMLRGKKPYVIFGASHATHCEPALQKLLELAK